MCQVYSHILLRDARLRHKPTDMDIRNIIGASSALLIFKLDPLPGLSFWLSFLYFTVNLVGEGPIWFLSLLVACTSLDAFIISSLTSKNSLNSLKAQVSQKAPPFVRFNSRNFEALSGFSAAKFYLIEVPI